MNIIETEIVDIPKDVKESKNKLLENIINFIYPMFNKEYIRKIKEIKKLKSSSELKRNTIIKEKEELEKIQILLNRKIKEQTILGRINKLVISGLIQESMKRELIVLLRTFDGMDSERINTYLNETMRIIGQKFAKS